jgi:hypothetical protein
MISATLDMAAPYPPGGRVTSKLEDSTGSGIMNAHNVNGRIFRIVVLQYHFNINIAAADWKPKVAGHKLTPDPFQEPAR